MTAGGSHPPSSRLGGNHRRRLLAEFRHMDELCAEMMRLCRAGSSGSPFEEIVQDLPAAVRAELQQGVEHLRRLMLQILEDRGSPSKGGPSAPRTRSGSGCTCSRSPSRISGRSE